jgi:signal peptidase II
MNSPGMVIILKKITCFFLFSIMESKRILRNVLVSAVLVLNIGCDQMSKKIIRNNFENYQSIEVIKDYFTILKIENTGAFLSWGESFASPLKFMLLSVIPVCALCLGLVFLFTRHTIQPSLAVGLACMIGGGIGNLFDRIVYGSVTDFLHINFGFFETGIFNIADLSIMTGMFIILINTRNLDQLSWKS